MQISHAREQYVRWLLATKDLSPHTIRAYRTDILAFERYAGAESKIERIDGDCMVAFVEQQQAAGLTFTSAKRRVAGLRGYCSWLVSQGHLASDPWSEVQLTSGRSRRLPRAVPQHELNRLLQFLRRAAGVNRSVAPNRTLPRPHQGTTSGQLGHRV